MTTWILVNSYKIDKKIVDRLTDLNEKLTGSSLCERIERYVLHSSLDKDYVFENGKVFYSSVPNNRVKGLASELLEEEKNLTENVVFLLRSSGYRLPNLGHECGIIAISEQWDKIILQSLSSSEREANGEFLGGYLSGVRIINESRWEKIICQLLINDSTRTIGIECVRISGLSENIIREMQTLYIDKKIQSNAFSKFSLPQASQKIPEATFKSMIETLLSRVDENTAQVVVFLVHNYYLEGKKAKSFPQSLIYKVLFCKAYEAQYDTMFGHYWYQIGKEYIAQYPDDELKLLDEILENLSNWDLNQGGDDIKKLSEEIVKNNPEKSWQIISRHLEDNDIRCHQINYWLRNPFFEETGNYGPIRHIPAESIIEWVKSKLENRAWIIIRALPKTLDSEFRLTTMFIEEFADNQDVANNIIFHFCWDNSWIGLESTYLEEKRDKARRWISETDSFKVRLWIDKYIDSLTEKIDLARIREERIF